MGDMEELPWEDDRFDLVTGFNPFFIADDMTRALREAQTAISGAVAPFATDAGFRMAEEIRWLIATA